MEKKPKLLTDAIALADQLGVDGVDLALSRASNASLAEFARWMVRTDRYTDGPMREELRRITRQFRGGTLRRERGTLPIPD